MNVEIVNLDLGKLFPVILKLVYSKKGTIREIVRNSIEKDNQLVYLHQELEGDSRSPVSLVYNIPGTANVYLVLNGEITMDTLIHECSHVIFRIFEITGSPITEDTEEFFSYMLGAVFSECVKTIKQNFKIKPKDCFYE